MWKTPLGCTVVALGVCLLTTQMATAATIFQESFEGTGAYTVTGGGSDGSRNFWSVLSTDASEPLHFSHPLSGVDGTHFFGGRDLNDDDFGEESGSFDRFVTFDEVDVSGHTDVGISIALGAFEFAGISDKYEAVDFLSIQLETDGGGFFEIDRFTGGFGDADSQLTNSFGVALGENLNPFLYSVADGAQTVQVRIQAWTTGSTETVAFDNLLITGTAAPMPEPTSALLFGIGSLVVGAAVRRKRQTPR